MFTTKSNLARIYNNKLTCYALKCKNTLVSTEDISNSLPPAVSNLLQDKKIKQAMDEEKKKLLESHTTTATCSPTCCNLLSSPPSYDGFGAEEYIDWQIAIDKMFAQYRMCEKGEIRNAACVLTSRASIWWNNLCAFKKVP